MILSKIKFRFGVCCVKIINDDDDTDINCNDTYVQNPDFPQSYNDEDTITYKVRKINNGNNSIER